MPRECEAGGQPIGGQGPSRPKLRCLGFSALLMLVASATGHAQPIPDPPIGEPAPPEKAGQAARPATPGPPRSLRRSSPIIQPSIQLMDGGEAPVAGVPRGFTFRISGLGAARAVHLYRFTPGCGFEQQPGISGLPLRGDFYPTATGYAAVYTTDDLQFESGFLRGGQPRRPGLPVTGGEAIFATQGVVGVDGGPVSRDQQRDGPAPESFTSAALNSYRRWIRWDGGDCTPSAFISVRGADNVWRLIDHDGSFAPVDNVERIRGRPWPIRAYRLVRVGRTADLRALLAPSMVAGAPGSRCFGTSSALGSPSYPVGIREVDGDIAFRIRSGPGGTRCHIGLGPASLPSGVQAIEARFSVDRHRTKCHVGGGVTLPHDLLALFPRAVLDRNSGMLVDPITVDSGRFDVSWHGWRNPFIVPARGRNDRFLWQSHLLAMVARLECDPTLLNDHGIELRLDSIAFRVPEGVNFP